MANGDIIAATIAASGWVLEPKVENLSTGGAYDLGYSTDLNPTDADVLLHLTSKTFTAVGGATTGTRTIRGTKAKRKAYPDEATMDETVDGSDVIIRLASSEWIYADDASITADIAAGVYTEGGTPNNAVTGYSVTNNSTQGFFSNIANWSIPIHGRRMGFDELTMSVDSSGYFEVRIMSYHRDGPIPCIKVTAVGQTSLHSETIYLTSESIDQTTYNDAMPIAEFIGSIPISGFTQGELVDIDFIAYPSIGDATVVMDTSATGKSMPTSWPCTQTVICDKNATYGTSIAVIDPISGNDGTGALIDIGSFDSESPPNAFQNIGAAIAGAQTFNNANYGRNEYGGTIIYLKAGNYVWTGYAAPTVASTTYLILAPFPGVSRSAVSITSQATDTDCGTYCKFNNITLNLTSTFLMDKNIYGWFHKCDFTSVGATQMYKAGSIQYITGCDISDLDQGFRGYSTQETYTFARGNTIDTIQEQINAHVFIGNHSTSGALYAKDYITGSGVGVLDGIIHAYNWIYVGADSTYAIGFNETNITANNAIGHAIINNVYEKPTAGSNPLIYVAGDQTEQYTISNIIIWGNTIVGQRCNLAYNDTTLNGIGPAPRLGWSIKGNIMDDFNMVTDVDSHGGTPSGDRTGNHSILHGCGIASNVFAEQLGAAGQYLPEFIGLLSLAGTAITPIDYKVIDNKSSSGDGLGNGDYHLNVDSPAIGLFFEQILMYDINEVARYVDGAAGAYEYPVITGAIMNQLQKNNIGADLFNGSLL